MTPDPASLDRLHDIVVADAAPWWPPAPGWLWLLGAAAIVSLVLGLSAFARWQQSRYRREALAELETLAASADVCGAVVLHGMAEILKRTALTAYSREQVAALTGGEWFAFLDRTGGTRFADGLGPALERTTYLGRTDWKEEDVRALAGEIRTWIRRHRPGTAATSDMQATTPDAQRAA